jgi:hypothetical protein
MAAIEGATEIRPFQVDVLRYVPVTALIGATTNNGGRHE